MADTAQSLAGIEGVEGVVVVAEDGVVLCHALEGDPEREGAVAAFVGGAAVQASQLMNLGTFRKASVLLTGSAVLVIRHSDQYIGLLLKEGASPALVSSRAASILGAGD